MYLDEKKIGEAEVKTLEPWRQLLLDAADYMEKHGHCKKQLENKRGNVCFFGSLYRTTGIMTIDELGRTHFHGDIMHGLEDQAARTFERAMGINSASSWNDQPGRTSEEVIAAMRKVAKS